ncbi:MAG: GH92 family glycosyl hydrolase [Bacteroidales bacterium]|nr:GH92 family glycosyl hydrolase [Bacteroidales bacterium]
MLRKSRLLKHKLFMIKRILISALALVSCFASAQNNSQYVNVFIGTDGTGHTFPGPSMPFGMVQPGPDNKDNDWAYTSGYQFRDTAILGFSQTHLSGTGIGELGDISLLPFVESKDGSAKNILIKNTEKASVGYYTATKKDNVKVELTASERVAFHRYTFPAKEAKLFINFQHGIRFLTDSLVMESQVKIEDNKTISGYCHTKNWVERKYFFVVKFDLPFNRSEMLPKGRKENAPKYILDFKLNKNKILQAKIALSTVDIAGAKLNLQTEILEWNFDKVKQNAIRVWNDYLGRIDIDAGSKQKQIFYTSLYHLLLQPSNIADVNGKYRGADDKIAVAANNEYYSTLSIWDVYRGAFPLLQIIAPEKINGIINTMLLHHKAAGFLPIWTAWGQDNYCMIGNHAIPMILSAYNHGFTGFDAKEALKAMVETSTKSHINSDWELYNQYGYYPFDKLDNEAVSRTLESGYDDWCVAEMASKLGDKSTAESFYKRAAYFKNLFDPETKMFRGKDTRGNFRKPFDPLTATSPMNNPGDYTEANSWQYFWTPAQYDIDGMKKLLGGNEAFTKQLNDFFTIEAKNPNKFLGQEAMIGQYAHGNEPGHHITYLYAYSDSPETGQKYIHDIINSFHNNTPDGMIGNDDCGQMSAWYILSSLGFYPVNPAGNEFVLGAPQLEKAVLHLTNGNQFIIEAKNSSAQNIYIEKVLLKGIPVGKRFITYNEIMHGGNLQFQMKNK